MQREKRRAPAHVKRPEDRPLLASVPSDGIEFFEFLPLRSRDGYGLLDDRRTRPEDRRLGLSNVRQGHFVSAFLSFIFASFKALMSQYHPVPVMRTFLRK